MQKEKKNPAIVMIVTGFLLFLSTQVFSQTKDSLKTYYFNDVVVTATRSERPLSDIGKDVSLITKSDLEKQINLNPADVLSNLEGINIIGGGQTPGSLQNIYMRGANANQTVIMIDGMRITDPSGVDNAVDLSELSLTNIQRIEVVRGTNSTLYGSSAIGGVVNFITEKNMNKGFNADINLRTGTFGKGASDLSQNVLLNYTTPQGFYFSGGVFNSKVSGLDATVKLVPAPAFKDYDKDGFNKTDLLGKTGYSAGNFDLFVSYKRTKQKSNIDGGAFTDDDNYTIDFKRNLYNYGATYKLSNSAKLSFKGGYTDMSRTSLNDSSVVAASGETDHSYFKGTYDGTVLDNELQANFTLQNIDAVLGGGVYEEKMDEKTFYYSSAYGGYESTLDLTPLDIKTTTKNIFAHIDINGDILSPALSDLSLALGSRYNHHSTFGDKFTYEINPSYKITKNSLLYVSYATGFNAPPLYRLFSPEQDYTSNITRGNVNLQPEESKSFEAGFKQAIGTSIVFTASYYTTEVKNNIEYVYLWDKNIPVDQLGTDWSRNDYRGDTYLNVGKLLTDGFEFSIAAAITHELSANLNASFVNGKLKYSPEDIDVNKTQGNRVQLYSNGSFLDGNIENDDLVRRSNTANLSLTYQPIDVLALKLNVKYNGKKDDLYYNENAGPYGALGTQGVSDYTLFDISVRYNLMQDLNAIVRVENIFDKQYTDLIGYRTRGRGVYLSLGYNFHQ